MPGAPATPPVVPAPGVLTVTRMEFAQTHVIPGAGLRWKTTNGGDQALHLVGGRDTLALIALAETDAQQPQLEAWHNGTRLGTKPLNAPSLLPPTEASGAPYATDRWSAMVPGAWMAPGVSFTVSAANYTASAGQAPAVGLNTDMHLYVLPFYLFGANDINTQPLSVTGAPSAALQSELFAKWPVASLKVHTVGRIDLPSLVVRPRSDESGTMQPAYVMTSMDQQKDSYAALKAVLDLTTAYREANGDEATNNQYYAPLLPIDTATGTYHNPGGGLGWSGTSTANHRFSDLSFHEIGHGFSLPHAGEAYDAGSFPYAGGSLAGSVWGYDVSRNAFLDVLIPKDSSQFKNCTTARQFDPNGRCYKQDPMQGGAGDRAAGYAYSMFSDYFAGKIQRWFEGTTTTETSGNRVYEGGRIFVDPASATGYSRWDSISRARVPVSTTNINRGLYGTINEGLPVERGVPVHAIAVTFSNAGTPGATQIYPPLARTGNLLRPFDPTNAKDMSDITPSTGLYSRYCSSSGCDYTLRVTYADGTRIHRVLEGAFRGWFQPTSSTLPADTLDPKNSTSFRVWAINVPGNQPIRTIELLDTPMAWNGLPSANPAVLASR